MVPGTRLATDPAADRPTQAITAPLPGLPGSVLRGRVDWAPIRSAQAVGADVVKWSTVELIDLTRQRTVQTTISDENGAFELPPLASPPAATHSYTLEAIKGLGSHSAGRDTLRLRLNLVATIKGVEYRWSSPVETPDGSYLIGTSATAVAVAFSHRQGTTKALDLRSLERSVKAGIPWPTRGLPDTYVAPPSGGLTTDEFVDLWAKVWQAVQGDRDPVEAIGMDPISLSFSMALGLHSVTALVPDAGKAGDVIEIRGSNFSAIPSGNEIFFGEIAAPAIEASSGILKVRVPAGAKSGSVKVRVGSYIVVGPSFEIR